MKIYCAYCQKEILEVYGPASFGDHMPKRAINEVRGVHVCEDHLEHALVDALTIYCHSCSEAHAFTGLEAERIIYALQGALVSAWSSEAPEREEVREAMTFRAGMPVPDCLKDVLTGSHDIEEYAEWTGELVSARRSGW